MAVYGLGQIVLADGDLLDGGLAVQLIMNVCDQLLVAAQVGLLQPQTLQGSLGINASTVLPPLVPGLHYRTAH